MSGDEQRIRYGYVVVTHNSPGECAEYEGRDCVQAVIVAADGLPFPDKAAADAEAATWPDWCTPHTVTLTRSPPRMSPGESSAAYQARLTEADALFESASAARARLEVRPLETM